VLQNRTGFLDEVDRLLMREVKPAYVKFPGHYPSGNVPRDLQVPLLLIFTGDEFKSTMRRVSGPQ
jgi:hypothetical protein